MFDDFDSSHSSGMVVLFNPHAGLLQEFTQSCVKEDLDTTPHIALLLGKAFSVAQVSRSATPELEEAPKEGLLCSVRYTKVFDAAGNFAYANPYFPMSVDLQACSYYSGVYQVG